MELTPAGTLLTGSYDGRVLYWSDAKTGAQPFSGFQHNNQVTAFGVSAGSSCVYSAGMDDTIKRVALSEDGKDLFGPVAVTAIDGIPKTISASSDGLVAALTSKGELVVMNKNGETVWSLKCDGTPSALAWSTTGSELSVGFTVCFYFLSLI